MENEQSNENNVGGMCCTFSIFSRVFWYVLLGGILAFMIALLIAIGVDDNAARYDWVSITVPIVLIVLLEWNAIVTRKRHGLSWWRGYMKYDLGANFDNNMRKLEGVSSKYYDWLKTAPEPEIVTSQEVVSGVDKSDIGYWYGLKEKGAISEEEYEVKKKELL